MRLILHAGEAFVAAIGFKEKLLIVEAEKCQDGGMEVAEVERAVPGHKVVPGVYGQIGFTAGKYVR